MSKYPKFIVAAALAFTAAVAHAADTITYSGWLGTYDKNADLIYQIQRKFKEKTGADLKIVDTAFDKALNQATVTTMAGNPADAIHLIAGWVPAVQGIGGLEPLDDYFSKEKLETIPKALRDSVSVDGKLYALPWVPGPIHPHYNRNLMKEAGLDPDTYPQTWPELMDLIKKICAIPIMYGHGGDVQQDGEVLLDTPENAAAFAWLQEVATSGCTAVGHGHAESRNVFAAGRAGVIFEGPWGRGLVENMSSGKLTVKPDGDVWVAPMPMAPDGTRRTIGNPHEITMSSKSKNKELTAAFLDMLIFDEDNTSMYFDINGQIPTSSMPLLMKGAVGEDAYSQIFIGSLAYTHDNPWKSPRFYAVMSKLAPEMQKIVKGGDIPDALAAADKSIQRLLSR